MLRLRRAELEVQLEDRGCFRGMSLGAFPLELAAVLLLVAGGCTLHPTPGPLIPHRAPLAVFLLVEVVEAVGGRISALGLRAVVARVPRADRTVMDLRVLESPRRDTLRRVDLAPLVARAVDFPAILALLEIPSRPRQIPLVPLALPAPGNRREARIPI